MGRGVVRKTQGKSQESDSTIPVGALSSTLHLVLEFLHVQLQDNSQMYEEWLALKCKEYKKIQSSLTHKLGTVPLLHVVCYLLILQVSMSILLFAGPP